MAPLTVATPRDRDREALLYRGFHCGLQLRDISGVLDAIDASLPYARNVRPNEWIGTLEQISV